MPAESPGTSFISAVALPYRYLLFDANPVPISKCQQIEQKMRTFETAEVKMVKRKKVEYQRSCPA